MAPGLSTARLGWTTSSTPWPGFCEPSRSPRRARSRPRRLVDPGGGAPSGWLWAAGADARAQPGPGRLRGPAPGRSAQDTIRLAAMGGAIGWLAACVVAALADPLLDALDVSDPSFRVAAGIVAVIAGAADLFRRPPPPEPSLPRLARGAGPCGGPGRDPPGSRGAGARRGRRSGPARGRSGHARRHRAPGRAGRKGAHRGSRRPRPPVGRPPAGGRAGRLRRRAGIDGVLDV